MLYLKSDEIATYAPRVTVDDEIAPALAGHASSIIDAHLRSRFDLDALTLATYARRVRLGGTVGGFVRPAPVRSVTSIAVRAVRRMISGGSLPDPDWTDLDVEDDEDAAALVHFPTGRLELGNAFGLGIPGLSALTSDFGRSGASSASGSVFYEADVVYTAGHIWSTELAEDAVEGATDLVLVDATFVAVGDRMTAGDAAATYRVTAVDPETGEISLASGLASALSADAEISERVPVDVKRACGLIVEDLLTYLPNTIQQTRKLDVLSDAAVRASSAPLPAAAVALLDRYGVA